MMQVIYWSEPLSFVQVFKAKWNGVQIVAVKQLRVISDDKAQLNFLREVIQCLKWRLNVGSLSCDDMPLGLDSPSSSRAVNKYHPATSSPWWLANCSRSQTHLLEPMHR